MSVPNDMIPKAKREHIYTREDFPATFGDENKKYWGVWDYALNMINTLDDGIVKLRVIEIMCDYESELSIHAKVSRERTQQERDRELPLDVLMCLLLLILICCIIIIIIPGIKWALM